MDPLAAERPVPEAAGEDGAWADMSHAVVSTSLAQLRVWAGRKGRETRLPTANSGAGDAASPVLSWHGTCLGMVMDGGAAGSTVSPRAPDYLGTTRALWKAGMFSLMERRRRRRRGDVGKPKSDVARERECEESDGRFPKSRPDRDASNAGAAGKKLGPGFELLKSH